MASEENNEQVEKDECWGTVEGPCPEPGCDGTIPKNGLTCPECGEPREFDQEQYDRLVASAYGPDEIEEAFFERTDYSKDDAEKLDIGHWNAWRSDNPDVGISLSGADIHEADLARASLQEANLGRANLQEADLRDANLRKAYLKGANIQEANLCGANLQEANLQAANLQEAFLVVANFQEADLQYANLQEAILWLAKLRNASLSSASLEGTNAWCATVNGLTSFVLAHVDTKTNFTGVGLDNARIPPDIKAHLRYNIRRMGWENWYEKNWCRCLTSWITLRPFWWISDYGRSTRRIIVTFFLLCGLFALLYATAPELIHVSRDSGFAARSGGTPTEAFSDLDWSWRLVPAGYFSIVTMTTLGFGDIHANPACWWSYLALSAHVLLGYVLLGALITRFAIMFQGESVPWTKHPTWIEWLRLDAAWESACGHIEHFVKRLDEEFSKHAPDEKSIWWRRWPWFVRRWSP